MAIVFYSNNNYSTLMGQGLGVCFGQCTFYTKISLERDCVKTDASTIQSNAQAAQALFVLDSGSYHSSRDRIFKLHGLKAGTGYDWKGVQPGTLAEYLVNNFAGKFVFIDVKLSAGAHVVAARIKSATHLEYFDPNDALFRETTTDAFKSAMETNFLRFSFAADVSFYSVEKG